MNILEQFGFPNTYTLTKHMTEQVLARRRGNIRMAFVRPSAIIACYQQPFPCWVDQVGTVSGVIYPMALGLNDTFWLKAKPFWFGLVPCDICSNAILVASMAAAK